MSTDTEKKKRVRWAEKDQAILDNIIIPIRTALAKGEQCDIPFHKAEHLLLLNPELSEKHGSGEQKAKFKKWYNSYSHQQKKKFENMAKTPSNNNKAAAKPPKPSLSPVPLNKDKLDCIKFIASEKMSRYTSIAEKGFDSTERTAKDLMDSSTKSIADRTAASADKLDEWAKELKDDVMKSARKR